MENPEKWLSVQGIADHLGISKETVYRWLEKGAIPAHRIGKLWRFKSSEIDDWIVTGEATTFKQNHSSGSEKCKVGVLPDGQ